MSDVAIRCEGLSKRYLRGIRAPYHRLSETLSSLTAFPYSAIKSLFKTSPQTQSRKDDDNYFWALKDISFEIKHGEVVGIIGRNGAGKSTLLKLLARITEPTTGHAEIHGRVGSLLEVGTGFHPELTGRENVYLNGAILGMSRTEVRRKFDEIVAFSGVEQFLDLPVKRYSSGMYMRLAFAVAAHLETEILIVDEVLAVGDAEFQKKCLGKMSEVAKGGRTVLFVSHNMGAIQRLCNTAIMLNAGQMAMTGKVNKVIYAYIETSRTPAVEIDLKRYRVSGLGNNLRFTSIRLAESQSMSFESPIQTIITLGSNLKLDYQNISIGCSVFSQNGECIGTLFTNPNITILSNQEIALKLTINSLNLAPGFYYLGFSAGRGGTDSLREDFDCVIGTPSFEIIPTSSQLDPISHWQSGWGNLVITNFDLHTYPQIKTESIS